MCLFLEQHCSLTPRGKREALQYGCGFSVCVCDLYPWSCRIIVMSYCSSQVPLPARLSEPYTDVRAQHLKCTICGHSAARRPPRREGAQVCELIDFISEG